jgi:protein gp37
MKTPSWTDFSWNFLGSQEEFEKPFTFKSPKFILIGLEGDLFDKNVPDKTIDRVFTVISLAKWHIFQILTENTERLYNYINENGFASLSRIQKHKLNLMKKFPGLGKETEKEYPFDNIWIGTSLTSELNSEVKKVASLLKCPAAVRFLQFSPLQGVDLQSLIYNPKTGKNTYDLLELNLIWGYVESTYGGGPLGSLPCCIPNFSQVISPNNFVKLRDLTYEYIAGPKIDWIIFTDRENELPFHQQNFFPIRLKDLILDLSPNVKVDEFEISALYLEGNRFLSFIDPSNNRDPWMFPFFSREEWLEQRSHFIH